MKKIIPIILSMALAYNVLASKDITKKAVDFIIDNYSMIDPQKEQTIYTLDEIDIKKDKYSLEYICKEYNDKCHDLKFEIRVFNEEKNILEIFKNYGADDFNINGKDRYIIKRNGKRIKKRNILRKEEIENKYIKNLERVLNHLENND